MLYHPEHYQKRADQLERQATVNLTKAEIAVFTASHVADRDFLSDRYGGTFERATDNVFILQAALHESPNLQKYLERAGRVNLVRKGVLFTDSRTVLTKDGVVFHDVRGSADYPLTLDDEGKETVRDLLSRSYPNALNKTADTHPEYLLNRLRRRLNRKAMK